MSSSLPSNLTFPKAPPVYQIPPSLIKMNVQFPPAIKVNYTPSNSNKSFNATVYPKAVAGSYTVNNTTVGGFIGKGQAGMSISHQNTTVSGFMSHGQTQFRISRDI